MLTILTFKWKPPAGYRSKFGPETVNTLYSMVRRHYRKSFRFVCLTDDNAGIVEDVETYPLWNDFEGVVPIMHVSGYPVCYRRLRMFSKDVRELLGDRFVALDLDVVIAREVTDLWDRDDDFIIYKGQNFRTPYNGSMILMKTGSRTRVWDDFDPVKSPKLAFSKGFFGSDQGWISACLGPGEKVFTIRDGCYSYRNDLQVRGATLPPDARMVIFHGHADPWQVEVQNNSPWIKKHYR